MKRSSRQSLIDNFTTTASKVRFETVVKKPDGHFQCRSYCIKGRLGDRPIDLSVEARFYRDLVPTLGVRVPHCRYVGIDEGS